jgi:PDZ domain-containing protein
VSEPAGRGDDDVLVRRRPGRRWWAIGAAVVVVALGLVVAGSVHVDYYSIAPGGTVDTSALLTVAPGKAFPAKGDVAFPTVSMGRATALEAFTGWLDPDVDVVKAKRVLPPQTTDTQLQQANLQLMDDSKEKAIAVALSRLGYADAIRGDGAEIVDVLKGSPADGRLADGDVIVAVGGSPVHLDVDAVDRVGAQPPGTALDLTVKDRAGAARHVAVTLGTNPSGGGPGKGFLGVSLRTAGLHLGVPFTLSIDSEDIGGPSAGLAFTLEVLDQLTAGELTGGHRVAATGTMELDGRVGDVGGVPQKTASVVQGRYDLFLVPSGEADQARARAGTTVKVVAVDTLDQALRALADLGGNSLALPKLAFS